MELFKLYPEKNEGGLTSSRMVLVNNAFQTASAQKLGLVQYLRALPLMVGRTGLKFQPPGRLMSGADNLFNEQYLLPEDYSTSKRSSRRAENFKLATVARPQFFKARVKPKVLADLTEAIIGSFYIQGGMDSAKAAVKALGSWPELLPSDFPTNNSSQIDRDKNEVKTLNNNNLHIPPKFPAFLARIANGTFEIPSPKGTDQDCCGLLELPPSDSALQPNSKIVDSLEQILGYRFQSVDLLEEATTHCSVQYRKNNQRLEFLGDAVLDFAVVSLLAKRLKHADQGDLSKQRSEATCNLSLGKKALQLGLQKYLFVMSNRLLTDFRDIQLFHELEHATIGTNVPPVVG